MSLGSSTRRAGAIAAALAAAAVALPVAVAGATSHAKLWKNKSGSVSCGVQNHPNSKPAYWILCYGKGVPRPTPGGVGDPFVHIAATGKPQLGLSSQYPYQVQPFSKAVTLANGSKWSLLGVTCTVGPQTKVTCSNHSGHGFTTGNGKYKKF